MVEKIKELQEYFGVLEEVNGRDYLELLYKTLSGEFTVGKYSIEEIKEQIGLYLGIE